MSPRWRMALACLGSLVLLACAGATTSVSVHVSVIPFNHVLENEGGNLFIATVEGTPMAQARWLDNRTIEISHHHLARAYRAQASHLGTGASYFVY